LLAAGVLAACSPLSPYQSTAAKLAQTEHVLPAVTSARFTPAPGSAARAAQLAECMEARGWHLVVRESNVAPPAEQDARGAAPQVAQ
jgi:hypothetical protein